MKIKPDPSSAPVTAWVYLMRIYCVIARCTEQKLAGRHLTLARFDLMVRLGQRQSCCTQDALCDELLVTKGNVSLLIDRMVKEGLIRREQNPENRRCNRIALIPKGWQIYRRVVQEHEESVGELFGVLTIREQEELGFLLSKLLAGLRQRCCGLSAEIKE